MLYCIQLAPGLYVGRKERKYILDAPDCSKHLFKSLLAAKLVRSSRGGTILPVNNATS
jgi:hypothetical protein